MYSVAPQNDEDFFANINYSKNIECITQTTELPVTLRCNGIQTQKLCFLYAEKMDFKGLIQLRLTEKCDQRRMYITTVDSASFHELKQDQSLHVTFAGFIEHLMRLLQDCQASKLELHLLQLPTTNSVQNGALDGRGMLGNSSQTHQLQFIEMRPFKNLVHLCLPSRLAPLNVVLFYMNSILEAMQRKITTQETEAQQVQHELRVQLHRIENLEMENTKLRDNQQENLRQLSERHAEELKQLQNNLQHANEQRHADNERHRKKFNALQAQLEQLGIEKANILAEKNHAEKRFDALCDELKSSKSLAATLREQNEKYQQEISSLKHQERKHEMQLSDSRKHVLDLQEKLRKFDKNKADIIAELEAEKKITHTKRQALEIATEEIAKANEIIMKQTIELKKLKKTIDWRTDVALQQEKAINEKEKMLAMRDEEIQHLQSTVQQLRKEIPKQLESMRTFATSLEKKYAEQIKALREQLKLTEKENLSPQNAPLWTANKLH